MNKALKKTVENELVTLITAALVARNKRAADKVVKSVRESSRSIARKFVKRLPVAAPKKAAPKKAAPKKRVATPAKKRAATPAKKRAGTRTASRRK